MTAAHGEEQLPRKWGVLHQGLGTIGILKQIILCVSGDSPVHCWMLGAPQFW